MIGRAVSIFGRSAVRARANNALVRGENAPGTVCINYVLKYILIILISAQYF